MEDQCTPDMGFAMSGTMRRFAGSDCLRGGWRQHCRWLLSRDLCAHRVCLFGRVVFLCCTRVPSPVPGRVSFSMNLQMFRFCRSKCHKNFKMKRNPTKLRWTKAFRRSHGKEMTFDTTFDLEKRRHRPVKYNRELVQTTVRAIKRISEIRRRREEAFYESRCVLLGGAFGGL